MDNSFLKKDDPMVLQQLIARTLLMVNTSIPATVQSFDVLKQTVRVTPNIRTIVNTIAGETSTLQMSDIINVPCVFPYSTTTGFSLTFPVKKGDQCLLIFSQRSIDNWHEFGYVQDPVEKSYPRSHALIDAIAIMGAIALPTAIPDWQQNAIEIRNKDRSIHIRLTDTDIAITAPSVIVNSNKTTFTGDVEIQGTASGEAGAALLTNAGISHEGKIIDSNHAHTGVESGSGTSGGVA